MNRTTSHWNDTVWIILKFPSVKSLPVAGSYTFSLMYFSWMVWRLPAQKFSGVIIFAEPEEDTRRTAVGRVLAVGRSRDKARLCNMLKLTEVLDSHDNCKTNKEDVKRCKRSLNPSL